MKVSYLNDEFFSRLETLALNLRTNLAGFFGGKHLVRTYGQTVEFADFREYQLGDDIRRIDWNLFSRFEKYFLRLFTDERQMQVQIFLDCSASMGKEDPKKAAYSIATAAALGFLAVQNMDKLTINFMREQYSENPFGTIIGKNAFFRAIGTFEDMVFEGDSDLESCVLNCPDTGDNNGITIIISDFLSDSNWKKAVDYLCYKKRQVLLIQILTRDELDPAYEGRVHLMDSEAYGAEDTKNMKLRVTRGMLKAYEEALKDFRADMKTFCSKRNVGYISISSDTAVERVLFGELLKGGIMS